MARVQLPLGWNTYLLLKVDVVNFVWKANEEGSRKHYFVNFMSFEGVLTVAGWGLVGWDRKSHLRPAEIWSFCSWFIRKLIWLNLGARGSYLAIQPSLAATCLLAITTSPIHPADNFIHLFPLLLKKMRCWMNPRFYDFVFGVDKGDAEVGWVQDFLV